MILFLIPILLGTFLIARHLLKYVDDVQKDQLNAANAYNLANGSPLHEIAINSTTEQQFTRENLLEVYSKIMALVLAGKIPYSESQIEKYHSFYKHRFFSYLSIGNVIFGGLGLTLGGGGLWLMLILIGIVSGICFQIMASKYEVIARQFLAGTLGALKSDIQVQVPVSTADEIVKLHKLKQDGVLSNDEFLKAKQKLVG